MNFSKTSKYALRILSFMAGDEKALYSAQQLHENIDVPVRYLRKLLTHLSKNGFIESAQGRNGGFSFTRSISEIYLSEIINSIDGLDSIEGCVLGYDSCAFDSRCQMHLIWQETKEKVLNTLKNTTLADIRNKEVMLE